MTESFRFAPGEVHGAELDDLNAELLMRLQVEGVATPSSTQIDGRFSIRVANESAPVYQELVSREFSVIVPDPNVPAPVTGVDSGFTVSTSTTDFGAVEMDWTSYNEVAQVGCCVAIPRPYAATSPKNNSAAIATLTAGPATAIHNSFHGSDGIRCSRATPPIGSNVMSCVGTP